MAKDIFAQIKRSNHEAWFKNTCIKLGFSVAYSHELYLRHNTINLLRKYGATKRFAYGIGYYTFKGPKYACVRTSDRRGASANMKLVPTNFFKKILLVLNRKPHIFIKDNFKNKTYYL